MDLYFQIKEQRKSIIAPVDYAGCCEVLESENTDVRNFQILIALVLSSQTKDEITHEAIYALNKKLGVLTVENVHFSPIETIHMCISKVGYHNKKAKYIKEIAAKIYHTKLPSTLKETLSLPGVGKKMAYLYLLHAFDICEGIGVDVHVHRISNRINLVNTKNEEQTRIALQLILPKEEWSEINKVLVGFGQRVCTPIKPNCDGCCVREYCVSSKWKFKP